MKNCEWLQNESRMGNGSKGELKFFYIEFVESQSAKIFRSLIYCVVVAVSGFEGYL